MIVGISTSFLVFVLVLTDTDSALTSYNETEARYLLAMSAAAYSSSPDRCLHVLPQWNTWQLLSQTNIVCDSHSNNCSAFVVQSTSMQQLIVAFRGTNKRRQLYLEGIQSVFEKQLAFSNIGYVDKYFLDAFNYLWPSILNYLNNSATKQYTVMTVSISVV